MKVSKYLRLLVLSVVFVFMLTSCMHSGTEFFNLSELFEKFDIIDFFKTESVEVPQTTETVFSTNTVDVLVNNEMSAYQALNSVGELYGFDNAKDEFKTEKISSLNNDTYYRFSQMKNGVPVYGKTMIVSAGENGKVFNINGNYCSISEDINTTPKIDNQKAQKKIEKAMKKELKNGLVVSEPELIIFAGGDTPVLTWKADVAGYTSKDVFEAYEVFVDANTGVLIYKDSLVSNLSGEFEGQSSKRVVNYETKDGVCYLLDVGRKIAIYKVNNNLFLTYKDSDPISWKTGENPPKDAVDAMANLEIVYDFFETELHHSSTDGKGKNMIIVETNIVFDNDGDLYLNNAKCVTYPTWTRIGIGENFFEESKSNMCDVLAHEFAHSVNCHVGNMRSGSVLNEAYADIFAICVEDNVVDSSTDWCIDDTRNIASPDKTKNPKHLSEFSYDTEDEHYNSTIISHAAYLMWEGDENSGAIKDTTKLAKLWYDSLYMLNSESTFSDCRTAVEISAQNLRRVGILTDEQVLKVSKAFNQVGIDPKPLYEIVAVNPELHVYALDDSEYYNYHCKIEKASLSNLNTVGKAVELNYEVVSEFDVTENVTVHLKKLVEAPLNNSYMYKITVSDLSDEPGTTQTKYVTVSHNSQKSLEFYTDFETPSSWANSYIEYIQKHSDFSGYSLIYVDADDIPELYLNGDSTAQGDILCVYDEEANDVNEYPMWIYGLSYIPRANLFLHSGGHMDSYHDIICSIEDYVVVECAVGRFGAANNANIQLDQFGEPIYHYSWNDRSVSKTEYEAQLESSYNSSASVRPSENTYTFSEMMEYLTMENQ